MNQKNLNDSYPYPLSQLLLSLYDPEEGPLNTELYCITREDDRKIFEKAADTFEQSYEHSPYHRGNWAKVWERTKQRYIAEQCCAQKKLSEKFFKEKYDQCTTHLEDGKKQLSLMLGSVLLERISAM